MKRGTILLVTLLSLLLVVGCGSSTDQTSIIPTAVPAAPVVAPAAAVSSSSVKVPAGAGVSFATTTAGATVPAAITTDSKVVLTAGATYTVTVDPNNDGNLADAYTYTFTQPATAGAQTAIAPAATGIVIYNIAADGSATKETYNPPAAGATVDTTTTAAATTETKTATEVTTEVGDVAAPAFTATFSHDSDVDGDSKYSKGDKFKVTVAINPAEAECKIYVKIKADGGLYVEGTRTYNSTAGSVTSAVVTTTDIANPMPHDTANTYMQTWTQYDAQGQATSFSMINSDGTFPYSGTYTWEIMVTDKAGNMAKATGSAVILP